MEGFLRFLTLYGAPLFIVSVVYGAAYYFRVKDQDYANKVIAAAIGVVALPFLWHGANELVFFVFSGLGSWHNTYHLQVEALFKTLQLYFWAGVWLAILAAVFFVGEDYARTAYGKEARKASQDNESSSTLVIPSSMDTFPRIALFLFVAALCSFIMVGYGEKHNEKNRARFYTEHSEFAVEDVENLPQVLRYLDDDSEDGTAFIKNGVLLPGHDPHMNAREADLSNVGVFPRTAPLAGARKIMSQGYAAEGGNTPLANTIMHIPLKSTAANENGDAEEIDQSVWSIIIGGQGINVPDWGIVTYNSRTNVVNQCVFDGEYELDRALIGERSNSLLHYLFDEAASGVDVLGLTFVGSDIYGYCEPETNQPVIVIPMQDRTYAGFGYVRVPAGVVLVKGSPSGAPDITHLRNVGYDDQIPGPVYPESLARIQREECIWGAGRENQSRNWFCMEPPSVWTQEGNPGEYHLFEVLGDGSLGESIHMTPLTGRNVPTQAYRGFARTESGVTTYGELNPTTFVVFDDDDERVQDVAKIELQMSNALLAEREAFFTNGGSMEEIMPSRNGCWVGFSTFRERPDAIIENCPTENRVKVTRIDDGVAFIPDDRTISSMSTEEFLKLAEALQEETRRRVLQGPEQ